MISIYFSQVLSRNEFLTKSLQSYLLQSQRSLLAEEWSFQKKSSGKLILIPPAGHDQGISVSLSHSEKYIAVAFSEFTNLGLDLQVSRSTSENLDRRIRSANDLKLPSLDLWCIKEATQKVLGLGFQLAMKDIEVRSGGSIRLHTQAAYDLDFVRPELNLFWKNIDLFPGLHSAIVVTEASALDQIAFYQIDPD